jgi:hypothetical protein
VAASAARHARDRFLDLYLPQAEWFAHDPYWIHGLNHVARVLVWAHRLAEALAARGEAVDGEAVRWAAALHDVGRNDDGRDPQHGSRSALWLEQHVALLPVALPPARLARVAYCCRWHVPPDHDAPEMTAELACLKDADGLDRVRIRDLDPGQLRLPESRSLVEDSWGLCQATVPIDRADPWAQVRRAALARGLWP